jgi:hypothetical protein
MLEPTSAAAGALAAVVTALAAEADAFPLPDVLLDGWASIAAIEYQAAVGRSIVGLLRVRAALRQAVAAMEAAR